jgi:tRNA threonylcarbamoyl adenosine modification protein YeaZ
MNITLAFESAIAGGSISLLNGVDEIDHWIGASDVSKAEDLLINIDALLRNNDLSRRDIDLIAVSAGPGSFTGIRIGMATALGLKNGLGVSMTSVSALEAMSATSSRKDAIIVVPMGRNSVCVQKFTEVKTDQPPKAIDCDRFIEMVHQDSQNTYIVHEKLFTSDVELSHVANFGSNVAFAVGLFAIKNPNLTTAPLFISKAAQ